MLLVLLIVWIIILSIGIINSGGVVMRLICILILIMLIILFRIVTRIVNRIVTVRI